MQKHFYRLIGRVLLAAGGLAFLASARGEPVDPGAGVVYEAAQALAEVGSNDASGETNRLDAVYLPLGDSRYIYAQTSISNAYGAEAAAYFRKSEFDRGKWIFEVPCWYMAADASDSPGGLVIALDRERITNVVVELNLFDADESALCVDLLSEDRTVVAENVFGNLLRGGDTARTASLFVPLRSFPGADSLRLRGARGEIAIMEALVYAGADALYGVFLDFDGDGELDENEWVAGAIAPAQSAGGSRTTTPMAGPAGAFSSPANLETTAMPRALPRMRMAGAFHKISRSSLNGGGKRQASVRLGGPRLEDSIAQGMPVGWATAAGNRLKLHAGYQQAEEEPLEIWNVSVTPSPFWIYPNQGVPVLVHRFNPTRGEIATLSYVLSQRIQSVTVNVTDLAGVILFTDTANNLQAGLHTLSWNGGASQPNKTYTFQILVTTIGGQVVTYVPGSMAEVTIETTANNVPVITSVADSPDPFSPSLGSVTISHTIDTPGIPAMTVEINNMSGGTVATFTPAPGGDVVWNGGTEPDGVYEYIVQAERRNEAQASNPKTGAIVLRRQNVVETVSVDGEVTVYSPAGSTIAIVSPPTGPLNDAMLAIRTAEPGLIRQSGIYEITASPSAFAPPAVVVFQYDAAIVGDIESKLQIRRFNTATMTWDFVPRQTIDYVNRQIIVEISQFSLWALFTGEDTTGPAITILSPVEAREYYNTETISVLYTVTDPAGVASVRVTLDGAPYDQTTLNLYNLLGEHELAVEAYDGAGNFSRKIVRFTVILAATVRLEPEALRINPGVLTAFVSLPRGFSPAGIVSATCDGAAMDRLVGDDATQRIIKFRRQDIEAALSAQGQTLNTHFVVRGMWTNETGAYVFQGEDDIGRIVE